MSELKQQDGESPSEWLARLRQLDPHTLSEHQRFFLLQHALDAARVAVKRQQDDANYALASRGKEPPPGPGHAAPAPALSVEETALQVCKAAYLALDQKGREQFLLWARSECK
jgi:hypothetical protein